MVGFASCKPADANVFVFSALHFLLLKMRNCVSLQNPNSDKFRQVVKQWLLPELRLCLLPTTYWLVSWCAVGDFHVPNAPAGVEVTNSNNFWRGTNLAVWSSGQIYCRNFFCVWFRLPNLIFWGLAGFKKEPLGLIRAGFLPVHARCLFWSA